jgi:hypothetical protein
MNNDIELAIIVPTRNRPDFIPIGIGSILKQIADLPIRVIVSDNSDVAYAGSNSTYIKSIGSGRFAYIRPTEILSMVSHWNWAVKHVLDNTPSTHFTILTDRGFYRSGALCELIDKIRNYNEGVISFLGDTILDFYRPIVIGENTWTGCTEIMDCKSLLSDASHCKFNSALPKALNSVTPSRLARQMIEKVGYFFPPTLAPDYGIAFELISILEKILFFNKPLTVGFGLRRSNGVNYEMGLHDTATVREFISLNQKSDREFAFRVPIPEILNSSNVIVHEYMSARGRHFHKTFPDVSMDDYLKFLFRSVVSINDKDLKSKYKRLLSNHGFRQRPSDVLRRVFHKLKNASRKSDVRSFASTADAIEYAYENYPIQSKN